MSGFHIEHDHAQSALKPYKTKLDNQPIHLQSTAATRKKQNGVQTIVRRTRINEIS